MIADDRTQSSRTPVKRAEEFRPKSCIRIILIFRQIADSRYAHKHTRSNSEVETQRLAKLLGCEGSKDSNRC